jgi:hypothetical protein
MKHGKRHACRDNQGGLSTLSCGQKQQKNTYLPLLSLAPGDKIPPSPPIPEKFPTQRFPRRGAQIELNNKQCLPNV